VLLVTQVLFELWTKGDEYKNDVYILPKHLDEKVARLHLEKVGVRLTTLTQDQADYINVPVDGPYKQDHYRYARLVCAPSRFDSSESRRL